MTTTPLTFTSNRPPSPGSMPAQRRTVSKSDRVAGLGLWWAAVAALVPPAWTVVYASATFEYRPEIETTFYGLVPMTFFAGVVLLGAPLLLGALVVSAMYRRPHVTSGQVALGCSAAAGLVAAAALGWLASVVTEQTVASIERSYVFAGIAAVLALVPLAVLAAFRATRP